MESGRGCMAMKVPVKKGFDFALDTLFPIEGLGCKKDGEWLCAQCGKKIPIEFQEQCFVCKTVSQGGRTCFSCRGEFPLARVVRFFNYDTPLVRESIRLGKYHYTKMLFGSLAKVARPYVLAALEGFDFDIDPRALIFVPMPLHARRLRERGFNQAEIVARECAEAVSARVIGALARRRATVRQADLDEADRMVNIQGAFSCIDRRAVDGQFVALVDDVATTGSTLAEAAHVLLASGAREVWGFTLAKG